MAMKVKCEICKRMVKPEETKKFEGHYLCKHHPVEVKS